MSSHQLDTNRERADTLLTYATTRSQKDAVRAAALFRGVSISALMRELVSRELATLIPQEESP